MAARGPGVRGGHVSRDRPLRPQGNRLRLPGPDCRRRQSIPAARRASSPRSTSAKASSSMRVRLCSPCGSARPTVRAATSTVRCCRPWRGSGPRCWNRSNWNRRRPSRRSAGSAIRSAALDREVTALQAQFATQHARSLLADAAGQGDARSGRRGLRLRRRVQATAGQPASRNDRTRRRSAEQIAAKQSEATQQASMH